MYRCSLCNLKFRTQKSYSIHIAVHKNEINTEFLCGADGCEKYFKSFSLLKSHLSRQHTQKSVSRRFVGINKLSCKNILKCEVSACRFSSIDQNALFRHLKSHMTVGTPVQCPFESCTRIFRLKSSFTAHLSRKHRGNVINDVVPEIGLLHDLNIETNEVLDESEVQVLHGDESRPTETLLTNEKQFLNSLALFYLKMQAQYMLPNSTIQFIIEDFEALYHLNECHKQNITHQLLKECNLSENIISQIKIDIGNQDLFKKCEDRLATDHLRKQYFERNFSYIDPKQRYLGKGKNDDERFFTYIPIKETLKGLLTQGVVYSQYLKSCGENKLDNFYEDFTDGKTFLSNRFFKENPSPLRLILYQDSFEVVNPLGSAKKKHKLLSVYMTVGNLPHHLRSDINQMQLVLLCKKDDFNQFGHDALFSKLINDINDMADHGIEINGQIVRGTVVAILGDNLGSHCIGGFTENFSTVNYFCRYCLITRQTFQLNPLTEAHVRDPTSYDIDAQKILEEHADMCRGLKFNSVFNKIQHFHVCNPGLPPCLGHDLFEGIVSTDLSIFIQHFVKVEKLFTYEDLNKSISTFKYTGSDTRNKPCRVNIQGYKLGGSAAHNWCLLRLLPFYIGKLIPDLGDNRVWQLCLQLRQIVDLITAPKISADQIGYLKVIIEDYIDQRIQKFPNENLKPKHHYLLHYPNLILHFGPLIRVWTLRFESKHSYFKQSIRKSHNFKNLTKTLAVRHQLLQAYYATGSLFPATLQAKKQCEFVSACYSTNIQKCVEHLQFSSANTNATYSLTYKGTTYKRNMIVVLSEDDDNFNFGKIELIIFRENTVYFILEKCDAQFMNELGLFKLIFSVEQQNTVIYKQEDLLDYYPLPLYCLGDDFFITFHHSPCSSFSSV